MTKFISVLVLVFGSLTLLSAQAALKKAEDEACKCMDDNYDDSKPFGEQEKVAENCIMQGFMNNYEAFEKEYGASKLMDESFSYELGEKLGMNLATNCSTFLKFSLRMVEEEGLEEISIDVEKNIGSSNGKVTNAFTGELSFIILQDADSGNQQKLYFIGYFLNAEEFTDLKALINKNITVEYKEIKIYDGSQQQFITVNEITGITKE